jgi:hypothetical protein
MVIQGESTQKFSYNFEIADAFYKNLVSFFEKKTVAPASTGLSNGFATTAIRFYALQLATSDGAVESAGLSTVLAIVVLLVMTRRLIASFLAAFQIACVVLSVTGVFVQLGWELNVIESVIFSLSVGLACDFAAHLAHSFNHQKSPLEEITPLTLPKTFDSLRRHLHLTQDKGIGAMTELGVTIVMGCLTTFMAGVVLLLGSLYFFQQFGTFLTCLMGFSLAYAFLLLMPSLAAFGWLDRLLASHADKSCVHPSSEHIKHQIGQLREHRNYKCVNSAAKSRHVVEDDEIEEEEPL